MDFQEKWIPRNVWAWAYDDPRWISRKFEEGWLSRKKNKNSKYILLSFQSNLNYGLACSFSRFTKLESQWVRLRARIRWAIIAQLGICWLLLLPDLPWNPTKSSDNQFMWSFVLWVLHHETVGSTQNSRWGRMRCYSLRVVQRRFPRKSSPTIRKLLYGSEEGLPSGPPPLSVQMLVYWKSTGNGSPSIISMWTPWGVLS